MQSGRNLWSVEAREAVGGRPDAERAGFGKERLGDGEVAGVVRHNAARLRALDGDVAERGELHFRKAHGIGQTLEMSVSHAARSDEADAKCFHAPKVTR